ncbi:MAG TPA: 2-amino-4-hydroxy-6-hydroxymethyldihydropteridine diphosphokinase [Phycisphaerales bacterium]|nr:2-amino-4-hydroxy-6-hydroxymethyldihydropteridine diphosphokinase [Phycisphaerales bacterium]
MPHVPAAIAFGSNLPSPAGDSRATVLAAIATVGTFRETRLVAVSSLHETVPVGPAEQGNYINAAAKLDTSLSARALLACMLSVEQRFGRDRSREERWGPRTLDLDLILFGDALIDEPGLRIPHPRMHERAFVLVPLCEVWPDAVHPVLKKTVRALRGALPH